MRFREIIKEGYKEVKIKFLQDANSEEIADYFDKFRDLVNRNQASGNEKNIDWWGKQGWQKFKNFVDSKSSKKTKTQMKRSKIKGDFHVIRDDDDWLIIIPLNKDASCYFGKNTRWCVTKRSEAHFEEYFFESKIVLIYFLNKKTSQKWAMTDHLNKDKAEYFDVDDTQISEDKFLDQTGLKSSLLDEIDEDVRFGELNKKINEVIDDYESLVIKLAKDIKNLDPDETSAEIEERIMEIGNLVLVEEYLENFEEPTKFSKEFESYIFKLSHTFLRFIAYPSLEQQTKAVEDNYLNFRYIKKPHPTVQMHYATRVDDRYDNHFDNNVKFKLTDENAQIELVSRLPHTLGLIRYPSKKVQIEAVSQSGNAIAAIIGPSKEVQMAAIKQDPWAISHIQIPEKEVIITAIQDDIRTIQLINKPSKEIQKMAVDIDPFVIGRIKNPDPEIKKYAEEKMKS
jgi:hypothetical protein